MLYRNAIDATLVVAQAGAALVGILVVAAAARSIARAMRQPPIVFEVLAGLAVGPVMLMFAGPNLRATLLPNEVLHVLGLIGESALALFLVGLAYDLRGAGAPLWGMGVKRSVIGSLATPLVAGSLVACWLNTFGGEAIRSQSTTPAFVLFVAAAFSVTAVPVLARLLVDRGIENSLVGALSMSTAVTIDAAAWLLFAVVLALDTGSTSAAGIWLIGLLLTVLVAWLFRQLLSLSVIARIDQRPLPLSLVLGGLILSACYALEVLGGTLVIAAFAFGLAIPRDPERASWAPVVGRLARRGLRLTPVFFVVTGMSVTAHDGSAFSWVAFVVLTTAAVASKIGGTYAATVGFLSRVDALRLSVLMNTRGLTDIIFIQAGFVAGIITPSLFVALTLMAIVTTLMTAPLLSIIDSRMGELPSRRGRRYLWPR